VAEEHTGTLESKTQLVEYIESGCKPPEDWRLGTEHEKFGFSVADLSPLRYEGDHGIRAILEGLSDQFAWRPVLEKDNCPEPCSTASTRPARK
jgi:glutamate--cysteine ligase